MTIHQDTLLESLDDYWQKKTPDNEDRDITKGALTAYSIMPMYPSFIIAIRKDNRLRIAGTHLSKKEITIRLCSYGRRVLNHHAVFKPLFDEITELYKQVFGQPSNNDAIMNIWNQKSDLPSHPRFKSIIFIGVEPRGYIDETAEIIGFSKYTLTALLFYLSLENWDFDVVEMPVLNKEVRRNLSTIEYMLSRRKNELNDYLENYRVTT